jgi:hypothetical protein
VGPTATENRILVFDYPRQRHVRRHGPQGYLEYQSYKPWLRDEFVFRCVYCLCRERWLPDGDDSFSVEHLRPRASAPDRACEYDNLAYACCRCNSARRGLTDILDPCAEPLAEHLEVLPDGRIRGLTPPGAELIRICQLDRPKLTEFRRGIIRLLEALAVRSDAQAIAVLQRYFGFPANLPRLATLKPPGGNLRPEGLAQSYHARSLRGDLPRLY